MYILNYKTIIKILRKNILWQNENEIYEKITELSII